MGFAEGGWGSGCHPSTRLCLEFLSTCVQSGDRVIDYGTGRCNTVTCTYLAHTIHGGGGGGFLQTAIVYFKFKMYPAHFSGVLAVGALALGAAFVWAVDVEAEALVAAGQNLDLNGFDGRAELLHVREV